MKHLIPNDIKKEMYKRLNHGDDLSNKKVPFSKEIMNNNLLSSSTLKKMKKINELSKFIPPTSAKEKHKVLKNKRAQKILNAYYTNKKISSLEHHNLEAIKSLVNYSERIPSCHLFYILCKNIYSSQLRLFKIINWKLNYHSGHKGINKNKKNLG